MGLAVVNRTACAVHHQLLLAGGVEETLLVVVRASFRAAPVCVPVEPAAIALFDRYRGDPTRSGLAAASDVVLHKPAVDLLFSGRAYPGRPGDREAPVRAAVGAWHKQALVSGARVWRYGVGGLRASAPEPIDSVPLIHERAFGGYDPHAEPASWSLVNPAGCGYVARPSPRHDGLPLPAIEYVDGRLGSPGERPPPCCFGPVAPHWEPRRRMHGTLDAKWEWERAPLPPADVDPLWAQSAPADQIYPGRLMGGEAVVIDGMRPDGARLGFTVPRMEISVVVHDGHARRTPPVRLDTLHVDAEERRVDLTWRAALSVHGWLDELEWILVTGGPQ